MPQNTSSSHSTEWTIYPALWLKAAQIDKFRTLVLTERKVRKFYLIHANCTSF